MVLYFCTQKWYSVDMTDTSHQHKTTNSHIIGRAAFAKISAVEGMHLTKEMRNDFQIFERNGLTPEERRAAITKKYAR